jgi:hypothetical protein
LRPPRTGSASPPAFRRSGSEMRRSDDAALLRKMSGNELIRRFHVSNVRFAAHYGLNSDIELGPKSANKRRVRSADDLSASTGSRRLRGTRFAGTPDLRWRSPINLIEHRIESPQATEACAHGDLRHREIGLVQKPLRPLHACRLGDLNRACTEVHLEEPGQMSRTDPETIGQSLDTAVIKCTVRDEPERTFDSGACSLPCRRERSSLRPAPQTRSETRKFGRRRRRIEHYVGRLGRAHRTDRAAVDTCRANARKE